MPPTSKDLALEARGVARSFRTGFGLRARPALVGVDLAVPRGTFLGLVGPNGSGKSTLVRLLAGVDRPTAGVLRVLGGDPRGREARQRSAYLPEDSPFPGELTAPAALDLLGALSGRPRAATRARSAELLERVGLAEARRTPLRGYSRGMLRRFGLAQAFLAEPDVVLLDEPTAGLDAPGFGVLDELLEGARIRGATVVLASHIPTDLIRRCDRLAVMLAGRVAAEGPPAAMLGRGDRLSLEVEGLEAAALTGLESWLRARGAKLVACEPSVRSLAELYGALPRS